jgi:hypothetical protein
MKAQGARLLKHSSLVKPLYLKAERSISTVNGIRAIVAVVFLIILKKKRKSEIVHYVALQILSSTAKIRHKVQRRIFAFVQSVGLKKRIQLVIHVGKKFVLNVIAR